MKNTRHLQQTLFAVVLLLATVLTANHAAEAQTAGFKCDYRLKTSEYGRSHFGFFSADSKSVFGGGQGGWLYKWNPAKERPVQDGKIEIDADATLMSGAATPNGKYLVVGSLRGSSYVIDPATLAVVTSFKGRDQVHRVTITPDSKWAYAGANLIDLETLTSTTVPSSFEGRSTISPDGKRLYTSSHNSIGVLDASTVKVIKNIELLQNVQALSLSNDGKYLIAGLQASRDGESLIKIIDTASFAITDVQKTEKAGDYTKLGGFLPDGKSILFHIWGTGMIRKLDVSTGAITDVRSGDQNIVLSPDGRSLLNHDYYPTSIYVCKF